MITFNCDNCGKAFSVADKLAGRKAKCKACGSPIEVPNHHAAADDAIRWMDPPAPTAATVAPHPTSPAPLTQPPLTQPPIQSDPPTPTPKKQKLPVRTRRLIADSELLAKSLQGFPLIQIYQAVGNPPDIYQLAYNVRGLARGPNGQPIYRDGHVVEIQLTSEYPRQSPKCRMLTPVFHPNIEPAMICVGDHWTAAERLVDLVIRIGEILTFQAYNIKSPLDGEAAMWADQNAHVLPTDHRDLRPPGLD